MSYFLHYFEVNNPNANWESYKIKPTPVIDCFRSIIRENELLSIIENKINYKNKIFKSYIISDGISSDNIFLKMDYKKAFLRFLKERNKIDSIIACFILKLNQVDDFNNICIDNKVYVLRLSLPDFNKNSNIEYETLYQIK